MMHIENLAEESGHISFIEYTATGIFVLKIKSRKYRGTKIQSKIFELEDDVQVVFNALDKDIYAVFNKTKQILYLNDQIESVEHFDAVLNLRKSLSFSMAVLIFALGAYPFYQYFMDGTVYYFDTFIHLTILTLGSCFVYFIYEGLKLNQQKSRNIEALFHMLDLPILSKRTLESLKLINSYFYEFDQLYDLSLINHLRRSLNNTALKTQLQQQTQKLFQFGLTQHELAKFKLETISGRLDQYVIETRESTTAHPDALTEIKFNLQGINFYSYLDDFFFVQGTDVMMIISQQDDSTGQYAWLIYDGHDYLSMDEELVQVMQRPQFPQTHHEKYMQTLRLITGFIVLVSFILFDIFAALVALAISIVSYYYFQFCHAVFLKFSFSKDIYAYLGFQSLQLFQVLNLKKLKSDNFKSVYLTSIARPSRTGFNIEKRRSR
ncbi:hypothetical protein ACG9YX_07955 [Acinetobacter nematophilus]|uniref:hypothetical protein n=1 Tax=Acinetobacter nematophilus TaxID=2994642 RepID=UPI003AF71E7E